MPGLDRLHSAAVSSRSRSIAVLSLLFLLSLPAVTARIYASDEVEGFSWLHSLAFDRDVSFENEYQFFYDSGQVKSPAFHETFLEDTKTEIGRRLNFTTMGAALLWSPFYAIGHVAAVAARATADGLSQSYISAVAIGSACYGFLSLLISAAIARRVVGGGLLAAVVVWAGTPLLFYMYITPLFAHACSAFAVALFLWTWLRVRETWTLRGAFALGLAGGLMALVRAQDGFFIAGPVVDVAALFLGVWRADPEVQAVLGDVSRTPDRRPSLVRIVLLTLTGAIGFFVMYLPQLVAFKALNGHLGASLYETRKMTWTAPHGLQVLFDTRHGLFWWTPLALLAVVGLLVLTIRPRMRSEVAWRDATSDPIVRDARWIGACGLVMFVLQAYIAGAVESWTVAGSFGQRRFVSLTPLLVLGLSAMFSATASAPRWIRWSVAAFVVVCVWWNLGLMVQFGTNAMDRQQLTLRQNAWATFAELPRQAPSLTWRYFTNRSSFYAPPRN